MVNRSGVGLCYCITSRREGGGR